MDYLVKNQDTGKSNPIRNTIYAGLAAITLASCGGGSSGTPTPPPVNRAPTCDMSVSSSPDNGYFPLSASVQGSCTDSDGDSLDVILYRNNEQIATGNNQNYTETIVENTTYKIEARDSEDAIGSASEQVTGLYRQLAFFRETDGVTNDGIYSVDRLVDKEGNNIDFGNLKRISPSESFNNFFPAYSLDGTEILFTSNNSNGDFATFRMNANEGSDLQDISSHLAGAEKTTHPDICFDGRIVVEYVANNNTEVGIGIIDSNREVFTPVYTTTSNIGNPPGRPMWNRDCTLIGFDLYDNGNRDVYTIGPDGSNFTQITNDLGDDLMGDFHSDGRIIFESERANPGMNPTTWDLWIRNNGGSFERLTNSSGQERDGIFSQNEEEVAFSYWNPDTQLYSIMVSRFDEIGNQDNWDEVDSEGRNDRYPAFRPEQ